MNVELLGEVLAGEALRLPVVPQNLSGKFHSDTNRIAQSRKSAIPAVSDATAKRIYDAQMPESAKKSNSLAWALALDEHLKAAKKTWAEIAEAMNMSESGIRHWRNGTREIKLAEFVDLCRAARADPVAVLHTSIEAETVNELHDALPEWRDYVLGLTRISREEQALILKTMPQTPSTRKAHIEFPAARSTLPEKNKSTDSDTKKSNRTRG